MELLQVLSEGDILFERDILLIYKKCIEDKYEILTCESNKHNNQIWQETLYEIQELSTQIDSKMVSMITSNLKNLIETENISDVIDMISTLRIAIDEDWRLFEDYLNSIEMIPTPSHSS